MRESRAKERLVWRSGSGRREREGASSRRQAGEITPVLQATLGRSVAKNVALRQTAWFVYVAVLGGLGPLRDSAAVKVFEKGLHKGERHAMRLSMSGLKVRSREKKWFKAQMKTVPVSERNLEAEMISVAFARKVVETQDKGPARSFNTALIGKNADP